MRPNEADIISVITALGSLPSMAEEIKGIRREVAAVREETRKLNAPATVDGWLDARRAMQYLSMSKNTFDKYRYKETLALKGSMVGGKEFFKKSDLDLYMKLFAAKSAML